MDRLEKSRFAFKQWEEGCITHLELVRFLMAQTTVEEVEEFLRVLDGKPDGLWPFDPEVKVSDEHRYDYAGDRLRTAVAFLLGDSSPEGRMLLRLLIDNELYGDELMFAIEQAEKYLREKGEVL